MRKIIYAVIVMMAASSAAEARSLPLMSQPLGDDMQLTQYSPRVDSRRPERPDRPERPRRPRFICVIEPPDSANRRRPYICPVDEGRVGGRCRCPGTVGNGNRQPAW
jgi:hypothetical protein